MRMLYAMTSLSLLCMSSAKRSKAYIPDAVLTPKAATPRAISPSYVLLPSNISAHILLLLLPFPLPLLLQLLQMHSLHQLNSLHTHLLPLLPITRLLLP
jgi:hypothetical protein